MPAKIDMTKILHPDFRGDELIDQVASSVTVTGHAQTDADMGYGIQDCAILRDLKQDISMQRKLVQAVIEKAALIRADAMRTEIARESSVLDMSDKMCAAAMRGADRARNLANHRIQELLQSTMPAATEHDAEIRSIVRQNKRVLDALDPAAVAAVLNAPPISSGLTQAEWDNVLLRHRERNHLPILIKIERARKALDVHSRTCDTLLWFSNAVVNRQKVNDARDVARHALAAQKST